MRSISDTITRLHRHGLPTGEAVAGRLEPLPGFGNNPGDLDAFVHVPAALPAGGALVVVLHGCTQTAGGYDDGSGWSALADEFGFALLFPQQRRANNPNLCFNWFVPGDTRRGGGEVESIRQMIATTIARHRIDPARVFVTGLSAGGAMTSAMLATHPELFAAGAIVAGLPYGVAASVPEALDRMRGHGLDPAALPGKVRAATGHEGPWPAVSVWHGTADTTVDPRNAAMIVEQWRPLHGVGQHPDETERTGRHRRRTWRDAHGRAVIEEHLVEKMGHGTPIATSGGEAAGRAAPHMLESGVSSTYRIAASWGLAPAEAPDGRSAPARPTTAPVRGGFDPCTTIDAALRAAGLIKG